MMTREMIYLAGLVHDIGKFWQRGDNHLPSASQVLEPSIKMLQDQICPLVNGKYTHEHLLWTAQFISNHKHFYTHLLGPEQFDAFWKTLTKVHRTKDEALPLILQKAIHLAAGNDLTIHSHAINTTQSTNGKLKPILAGLLSDKANEFEFPIVKLKLDESFFPKAKPSFNASNEAREYQLLWNEFDTALKNLHQRHFPSITIYAENLLFLLQRYTVTTPFDQAYLPDVSLYDHLKSTAAFAVCLDDYLDEQKKSILELTDQDVPFLLVGGDLSGIQSYIYDIVSANAAKNLKGRSFYLQLLCDNIVQLLLKELALPAGCIIYTSGGSFYVVAPNTEVVRNKLDTFKNAISTKLYHTHKTQLYLSLGYIPFKEEEVSTGKIDEVWRSLGEELNKGKRQKFKNIITTYFDDFFNPIEVGGQQARDAITNEEFTPSEIEEWKADKCPCIDEDPAKPIKRTTKLQIELGKRLKKAVCWLQADFPIIDRRSIPQFEIFGIGIYNYFLSFEDLESLPDHLAGEFTVLSLSEKPEDVALIESTFKNSDLILGFTFYGGNGFPSKADGTPLEFDELASSGTGADKLGVLRMDVDGLGAIFAKGLGHEHKTFSRYSAVSRNLDYFFKGYLNTIWSKNYADSCYILYSGGDDLFILGNWQAVTEMALTIRTDFASWTCGNPHLTLSGGVAIVPGKFPISKAALLAEEAEKLAKNYSWTDDQTQKRMLKNSLTLFDVPVNGITELNIVIELKKRLVAYVSDKHTSHIPRGLLNKLINYFLIAQDQKEKGLSPSWKWHLAYDFGRASKRVRSADSDASFFFEELKISAFTNRWNNEYLSGKHDFLQLLSVAARWAELETKVKS